MSCGYTTGLGMSSRWLGMVLGHPCPSLFSQESGTERKLPTTLVWQSLGSQEGAPASVYFLGTDDSNMVLQHQFTKMETLVFSCDTR